MAQNLVDVTVYNTGGIMAQKKVHSCVEKLKQQGKSKESAYAICYSSKKKGKKKKKKGKK